jgi:hypothetical protein
MRRACRNGRTGRLSAQLKRARAQIVRYIGHLRPGHHHIARCCRHAPESIHTHLRHSQSAPSADDVSPAHGTP